MVIEIGLVIVIDMVMDMTMFNVFGHGRIDLLWCGCCMYIHTCMIYPTQIYTGGAGEGGGFLKVLTTTLPGFVLILSRCSLAPDATATKQI